MVDRAEKAQRNADKVAEEQRSQGQLQRGRNAVYDQIENGLSLQGRLSQVPTQKAVTDSVLRLAFRPAQPDQIFAPEPVHILGPRRLAAAEVVSADRDCLGRG